MGAAGRCAPGGGAPAPGGRAAAAGGAAAAGRAAAGAGAAAPAEAAAPLPPVSSFTRLMSAWLSKGFAMWPSARAWRARASSNASKVPASRRTGMCRSAASPFTASQTS